MTKEAKIVTGVGLGILVLFSGLVFLAQKQRGGSSSIPQGGTVTQEIITRADSHATANTPTRVTVTEFGDYQCPACATAHPPVKEFIKLYQGKVSFVFRHFPLAAHANAQSAAQAAEAAALQGKFWEMHDLLYTKQAEWSDSKNAQAIFAGYAQTLGLDLSRFAKDKDSSFVADRIKRDTDDGAAAQVNATPTFFINTKPFVGVPSKEFIELLEKELAG